MTDKLPAPPPGSAAAGRKLWRAVLTKFELEDHEMALLERACRVSDSCAALQVVVDKAGVMTVNRFGDPVPHPALVELRQQSIVLARLIIALRVPIGLEATSQRQQYRGARGVYGAVS